jgi:GR25 family glycosyltransferase involved in LPS biosynthesis
MQFKTYVINLDSDNDRYSYISELLSDVDINPIRFSAIYGKDVKNEYNEHINLLCKPFIPKSILGCALSHAVLSKQILETDNNDIALILEDDVIPAFNDIQDIFKVIENAPQDWDIILLFCQGMCNYKSENYITGIYPGSTAAYLINKKGMCKQSKYKYSSHVDIQRKNLDLNVYKSPVPLFIPNDGFLSHNKKSSILNSFDKIFYGKSNI